MAFKKRSTCGTASRWLGLFLLGVVLASQLASPLSAQRPESRPVTEATVAFDSAVFVESFDMVWSTIRDTHWDPAIVGEKWTAARDKFRPLVQSASSAHDAREVIEKLLQELGQSHFGIIPVDAYASVEERSTAGGSGYSGITPRWIESALVIAMIDKGSPAETAGLRTGWKILSIQRGESEKVASTKVEASARNSVSHSVMRFETALGLAGEAFTTGKVGEEIKIELEDLEGNTITKTLTLVKAPGQSAKLGHLPLVNVAFTADHFDGEIGYIRFNAFLDAPRLIREYESVLKNPDNQKGLVIDLRGNRGGLVLLTMGMAGWFAEEPVSLGKMIMRNAPLEIKLNPRSPRYTAPVAVLIDECSISAAEIMAGGLRDNHFARVFGSTTAGLVLPSVVTKLPSGDGFQYAMADYQSASGKVLEGKGVEPDQTVPLYRASYKNSSDPVLDAALEWIRSGPAAPQSSANKQ